jgi:sortase (surface protein transpeptidase)
LNIEKIGVHSRLHDLGLDSTGAIEAPSGARYDEAAWYRHSPMPGSLGPSIILGHVDSTSNGPSVFFRLGELVRGDRISVTRADGSIARFTVQSTERYPKESFPTERVYGDLDHAGLRLITCGGAFNESSGHYEDNIVVFAQLDAP